MIPDEGRSKKKLLKVNKLRREAKAKGEKKAPTSDYFPIPLEARARPPSEKLRAYARLKGWCAPQQITRPSHHILINKGRINAQEVSSSLALPRFTHFSSCLLCFPLFFCSLCVSFVSLGRAINLRCVWIYRYRLLFFHFAVGFR